eukprot:scaffold39619_cov25-Attheya_sp.AAC.1
MARALGWEVLFVEDCLEGGSSTFLAMCFRSVSGIVFVLVQHLGCSLLKHRGVIADCWGCIAEYGSSGLLKCWDLELWRDELVGPA